MRQDSELINECLAHGDSSIRGDYNRAGYLEKRVDLKAVSSEHIEQASVRCQPAGDLLSTSYMLSQGGLNLSHTKRQ